MRKIQLHSCDYEKVAELHIEGIPFGFLSSMGIKFLAALYRAVDSHCDSVLFVERDDRGQVAGFLAGTTSVKDFYKYALSNHFFRLIIPVMPMLFSIQVVKRIFETLLYPFSKQKNSAAKIVISDIHCELLSVAVSSSLRGKGIGKKLIADFETFLINKGITGDYKVVTSAEDPKSNAFYKSRGFVLHHEFLHHENRMNEYRKSLRIR
jgi:ribosomal protein S18 acetylase RimI-like enzyme